VIGVELSQADDFVYIMGTARERERERTPTARKRDASPLGIDRVYI
jgi:hypothetical protein